MSTFNSGLPNNASKIRNYPTLLQNNFRGIEIGDATFKIWQANFPQRNLLPGPPTDDPTALADTSIIYAKEDPAIAGKTELFAIDPDSDVIQLTQGGSLGSAITTLKCSTLTIGSNVTQQGIATALAAFPASAVAGLVPPSYGYNIAGRTRSSTGIYAVTTTAVFNTANIVVSLTPYTGSSNPQGMNILIAPTIAANVVTINIDIRDRSGSHADLAFHILVHGGI
jgi:hypothetical protein